MAISKLHSTNFFSPPTPLPTQTSQSPPPQLLTLHPSKHMPPRLSLQPKTQFLIHTTLLKHPLKTQYQEDKECPFQNLNNPGYVSVAFPALAFANTLFFKSGFNVQVIVGVNEREESLIGRFRRDVLKAGVIQESKRRRFFETTQEKRKRKVREAARRNRKRLCRQPLYLSMMVNGKAVRMIFKWRPWSSGDHSPRHPKSTKQRFQRRRAILKMITGRILMWIYPTVDMHYMILKNNLKTYCCLK